MRLKVGHRLTVTETALAFLKDARQRGNLCRPLDWIPEVHHPLGSGEAVIPDALLYYQRHPANSAHHTAGMDYGDGAGGADGTGSTGGTDGGNGEGNDVRGGVMLRAFVEVDRATMGPERLAAKLGHYARLHSYTHPHPWPDSGNNFSPNQHRRPGASATPSSPACCSSSTGPAPQVLRTASTPYTQPPAMCRWPGSCARSPF